MVIQSRLALSFIAAIFVVLRLLFFQIAQSLSDNELSDFQTSPSPISTDVTSTIAVERTAIAQFTQSPKFAASMTPFYAQIIYNEVLRNLTEISYPSRPCYLNPADAPKTAATPIAKCGPFIGTITLTNQGLELTDLINKAGIVGYAGIESYYVGPIDGEELYETVHSRVGFVISVETVSDQSVTTAIVTKLVDLLLGFADKFELVSANPEIYFELGSDDGVKYILTTFDDLVEAHQNGLTDDALIQALGGFIEGEDLVQTQMSE